MSGPQAHRVVRGFAIRTSDRVPRGTVYMHPADVNDVRSPTTLIQEVAAQKRRLPPVRRETDAQAKARIVRQVAEVLEHRRRCAHEWHGPICQLCGQPKECV